MAFPVLIRWTANKCGQVCCRSSVLLHGQSLTHRSFSIGRTTGVKFLQDFSHQNFSGQKIINGSRGSVIQNNFQSFGRYSTSRGDKNISGNEGSGSAGASASDESNDLSSSLDTEEECTLYLSDEDLDALTDGDPELIKRVRHIQLEHEVFRQEGMRVPTEPIPLKRWEELIRLESSSKRKKYYVFLFKLEHTKRNESAKKEARRKEREEYLNSLPPLPALGEDEDGTIYGLNRNTLFLRLRENTEFHFYHNRVLQAMKFGPRLVIDCGYDHCMTPKENKYCSNQIELSYAFNRLHPSPMDLHLCNLAEGTILEKYLLTRIPPLYEPTNPLTVTSQSYLDVFPKERLVYLTPHTRDDLMEFDEDDVYIIGGIVDMGDGRPLSLAKAKKEGLRMKRLPLDQFLLWGQGGKSLTIDQMVKIMLDVKYYKSWEKAFQHVPKRKLFNPYGDEDIGDRHPSAPGVNVRPPTFVSRTGPKTIFADDEGQDLRRNHNANRVNVIESPLPSDRYQRPLRNNNSYDRNQSFNRSRDSQDSELQNNQKEFNAGGFSNPKGNPNNRRPSKINLRNAFKDTN